MLTNQEAQNVDNANPQTENIPASEMDAQTQDNGQDQAQRPSAEDQERNWKALRESKEEERRRNEELARQNAELTSLVKEFVAGNKQPSEPENEEDDLEIPTLGQTKKTIRREAEKIAREMVNKTLAERDQVNAPNRLKLEYSDFDSVVSKENVDYLIKNEPELAAILKDTKDAYKQGKAAYKFIKTLGISKKDNVEGMRQDSINNMSKPVSPNAISGRNSVGEANRFSRGLTPDLQKQLYQEMQESIRRG
jgi:hypothetical protein